MTKSELIEQIVARSGEIHAEDVRAAINALILAMATALAAGRRIELRDFGTFHVRSRDARLGRNPLTGEPVRIARKHLPHFKPGKELRERVQSPASLESGAALAVRP
jgi:integration host factor subunit beta